MPRYSSTQSHPGLGSNQQGAIFIEFLVVVLPFLLLLFGLAQLALLYTGSLAVQRSAATAVRAAVVVLDDNPSFYGGTPRNRATGQRAEAIELAASFPLYALRHEGKDKDNLESEFSTIKNSPFSKRLGVLDGLKVEYPGGISSEPGAPITVKVTYEYGCDVPLARALMCSGGTISLSAEATMPNQAADYEYGAW